MDFLNSYFPITPLTTAPNSPFEEKDGRSTSDVYEDEQHLSKVREGDYSELREIRKNLSKRNSRVQFIAPICEEGESLKSVILTPKPKVQEVSNNTYSVNSSQLTDSNEVAVPKSKHMKILGIKLLRRHSFGKGTKTPS